MKNIFVAAIFAFLFFGVGNLIAQDKKLTKREQRKIERAEQKQAEKEMLAKRKAAYLAVAKDSSIVIEAHSINVNNRINHQVGADNFIKISGDQVVIQTSDPGNIGYNGMGGITILGKIISYKVSSGKKSESIRVNVQFHSQLIGHSSVILNIQPSGYSTAYLTDNFGNNVNFAGIAYSVEGSTVYQGQSTLF